MLTNGKRSYAGFSVLVVTVLVSSVGDELVISFEIDKGVLERMH
jgi:hypothetical protein